MEKKSILSATPQVITMCGSTRFADLMAAISWELEKLGNIVLRVNFVPDWYVIQDGWKESAHGAEQSGLKELLDELHCRKIDISDSVFVCNYNGYIGESTKAEIAYAKSKEKPVYELFAMPIQFINPVAKCLQWYEKSVIKSRPDKNELL